MHVLCCKFLAFRSSSLILTLFINIWIYLNSSIKALNKTHTNKFYIPKKLEPILCMYPRVCVQQCNRARTENKKNISGQIRTHTHGKLTSVCLQFVHYDILQPTDLCPVNPLFKPHTTVLMKVFSLQPATQ